ncbi:hypothetical protein K1719_030194 [Acacia pycnantha]|nr:hypothetical protein K1719_030194 [Acacia pycnantha]
MISYVRIPYSSCHLKKVQTRPIYIPITLFDNLNRIQKPTVYDTILDFTPEDVTVKSFCNGLVCCRHVYPSKSTIYDCNSIRKAYVSLNYVISRRYALAFDLRKGSMEVTIEFKLVSI